MKFCAIGIVMPVLWRNTRMILEKAREEALKALRLEQGIKKRLVMQLKLITILLVVTLVQAGATGYSQKITLSEKNSMAEKVFRSIEKQTGYVFFYDHADLQNTRISIDLKGVTLNEALDRCFAELPLSYKIIGNTIAVKRKTVKAISEKVDYVPVPIPVPSLRNQLNFREPNIEIGVPDILSERRITGRVTDERGEGLPGVSILVKGTQQGTTTDAEGSFNVNVPDEKAVLVFSYVGYVSEEVVVSNRSNLDVTLLVDEKALEEVVVVGYGTQRKVSLTGSLSTVESAVIKNNAVGSVSQALQGNVAGATITNANTPGSDAKIRIRGLSTINNNNPLWVVDGVPRTGGINQISPSEIETITILKDASATAIYGARGANGVILVTTIRGKKSQAPQISLNIKYGTLKNIRQYDMLDVNELGEMLWLQYKNSGIAPSHPIFGSGAEPRIPKYLIPAGADDVDLNRYDRVSFPITETNPAGTDWYNEIFNKGVLKDYSLTVTGGSSNTTYGFSASALKEDGIVIKTGYERYTVRSNIAFEHKNWLEIGENFGLSYTNDWGDQRQNGEGSIFGQLLDVSGIMPIYDVMGNWAPLTRLTGIQANLFHPLAELEYRRDQRTQNLTFNGNTYLRLSPIKGLSLKTQFGVNYGHSHSKTPLEINPESYVARVFAELSESYSKGFTWNWINTADYFLTIGGKHNVDFLIGTEAISSLSESLGASRNQFLLTSDNYWVMDAGEGNIQNSGSASDWSTFSVFGRINYDYEGKYLVSGTLRRDGSSRFGANNRYGMFPALSMGWVISQESFMGEAINWMNFLKLRYSWGKAGNDQIGNYNEFTTFNQNRILSYYPITGSNNGLTTGFQSAVFGNPNARWESTTTTNLGVDVTLFRNFDIVLDLWKRNTNDMLYRETLPLVVGQATIPFVNIGDMQNRGFDFQVDYKSRQQDRDLNFSVGLVLSHYKNKILKLSNNESEAIIGSAVRDQIYTRAQIGTSFPQFFGYQVDGLFQTQEEVDAYPQFGSYNALGRFKFKDVNEDGVIDDLDRTYIGNPHPDFTSGLNGSIQYKNFDLGISFYASIGNDIINLNRRTLDFNLFQKNRGKGRLYESWGSPYLSDNRDAKMPIAEINDAVSQLPSSYFVEDGSFLRLQSVQLGFNVPKGILDRLFLKQLRVYGMVTNLLTWTKYSGLDPQMQTNDNSFGMDIGEWPTPRRFVFGININL